MVTSLFQLLWVPRLGGILDSACDGGTVAGDGEDLSHILEIQTGMEWHPGVRRRQSGDST